MDNLESKEIILRKKSRQKLIREGDLSTRYFHSMLKLIRRIKSLISIETNRGRIEGVANIKEAAKDFLMRDLRRKARTCMCYIV